MSKPVIYLASAYGFSAQWKAQLLPPFVRLLEGLGAEVWEPFARNNQVDFADPDWAYQVGLADLEDVRRADGIFAIVNGTPPDEGVMVELGAAIAWGKPTFLFRDDFRRCTDSGRYPLNLMLFVGLPKDQWEDYYYTGLEQIADPQKALVRWLKEGSA